KCLKGAGPESRKDVIAIRSEEIPVARPGNPCARRPASAAQHFSFPKPWLRIILVGVGCKSWERGEVGGRPFPDITDHLPAAECAVATRASRNIHRSIERKIQICMIAGWHYLAPGPCSLHLGKPSLPDDRFAERRGLPLDFGRQPALGPAAPGVRFEPAYKHNGGIQLEFFRAVVATPLPY